MDEVKGEMTVEEAMQNPDKPQEQKSADTDEIQMPADTQQGAVEADEEKQEDPFLKYIRQAFAKEHIDEFMAGLTDDQKSFIYVFCSGFETAIGRHIVGVYDSAYIEGYHFTKEVLDSLRIIVKPVDVKDTNLKFTIVAQLV